MRLSPGVIIIQPGPLHEKCPYSEFSGPYFPTFRLNTEIHRIFPYSNRMRENTDQKNSESGHFPRSGLL